jgi:hypothetical protein
LRYVDIFLARIHTKYVVAVGFKSGVVFGHGFGAMLSDSMQIGKKPDNTAIYRIKNSFFNRHSNILYSCNLPTIHTYSTSHAFQLLCTEAFSAKSGSLSRLDGTLCRPALSAGYVFTMHTKSLYAGSYVP